MINKSNVEVSLASHIHQVPQTGFPHRDPVKSVKKVNKIPDVASDTEAVSNKKFLYIKNNEEDRAKEA